MNFLCNASAASANFISQFFDFSGSEESQSDDAKNTVLIATGVAISALAISYMYLNFNNDEITSRLKELHTYTCQVDWTSDKSFEDLKNKLSQFVESYGGLVKKEKIAFKSFLASWTKNDKYTTLLEMEERCEELDYILSKVECLLIDLENKMEVEKRYRKTSLAGKFALRKDMFSEDLESIQKTVSKYLNKT